MNTPSTVDVNTPYKANTVRCHRVFLRRYLQIKVVALELEDELFRSVD